MTKLVIGKDRISVIETEQYVSGTKDAYKCTVTFSKDWDGLTRKLYFRAITGSDLCDELYASVPIPALSMKFALPNKLFANPASKLQVSATGSRKQSVTTPPSDTQPQSDTTPLTDDTQPQEDEKVLRTPWTTLGRIIEGASSPCDPDSPDQPDTPGTSIIPPGGTKDQVLAKASDDDYDFYWMSVQSLPVVTSAGVSAPLKTVMYFAGDLSEIPEGWALCDGQNGTPDLMGKVIIGATTDGTVPSEGLEEGTAIQINATLYPIMNLSAKPGDGEPGADGKSAYEIAVDNGFIGTEQEWLASLQGKSAYDFAVDAGFTGTKEEFGKALKAATDIPSASTLTISSKSTIPEDGAGAYYFEDVSLSALARSSVQIKRDYVYIDDSDPTKLRVTTLSGAIYDCVYAEDGDAFASINIVDKEASTPPIAAQIGYNDTTTNLGADNVQDVIEVLAARPSGSGSSTAADVTFDDTTSNLGATTVQSAIDTLAARPSGGGGDTPSDFTPVKQFKPAAGSTGPFILNSAKPFLDNSSITVRFTHASLQLPDGTNIHSFEDEFVYVRRLPAQVLEFYMSDGEVLQITYKDTTKDFVSFKMEASVYENVFTLVKYKNVTSTTELYAAFEQNTSKCYHLKNVSFQKIGDKAQFFTDDIVSVTLVTGSEVCYINGLDRTLRLTWDSSAGTAFTAVELVETAASDVAFDDTIAKLGVTSVQAAVDSLAEATPIIKNATFTKASDLALYPSHQTYRLVNVRFTATNGPVAIFTNDPVYFSGISSDEGYAPTLYTIDGKKIKIIADDTGAFANSVRTDAFDTAAPEPLPFQVIENVTFTSFGQFEELGIASDEVFLARNVTFKLPDAENYAFKIYGTDWVKAGWSLSMSLKTYSSDAEWHIEWNENAEGKPFSKIENWNNREGLNTAFGVTTGNVNDLLALRSFFDCAIKLRDVTITTSAGEASQRSYENDVVYAENDETSKTVTITRLNNEVDIFTYDDTGAFTSVTTKELNDFIASALPFPVVKDKSFASIAELETAGVTSGRIFYAENVVFNISDNTHKMFSVRYGDFVMVNWYVSLTVRILGSNYFYIVDLDNDTEGKPFEGYRNGYTNEALTTIKISDITTVAELKEACAGWDNSTVYFYTTATIKVGEDTLSIQKCVADVNFDETSKEVTVYTINGAKYTISYGDDGVFTSYTVGQNGSKTFGDGLSETNDVVTVVNPNRGVFTQGEFDALSEEEKSSGTYVIDDGSEGETFSVDSTLTMSPTKVLGVSNPTRIFTPEDYNALSDAEKKKGLIFVPKLPSTAELMKGYTYSFNERIVGTWIDEKLLYQRTVDLSNESFPERDTDTAILQFSDYSIMDIVKAEGVLQVSWLSQKKYFVPSSSFMLNTSNETLYLRQTIATQYVGQPYSLILTILYTKSNDASGEKVNE